MKLASLRDGRDGRLVVVSEDLSVYADARSAAPTLQAALDRWQAVAPALRAIAAQLALGAIAGEAFSQAEVCAPLPRAYQWIDGSAYVNHVDLVRKARGATIPDSFWVEPLMYQGGSDGFLGARDPIPLVDEAWGCDLEAEVCVVTGDVPLGADRDQALAAIRLVGLVNDVSLRNLIPGELAKGFGFLQSKPASAFSPVFVTPDALGEHWRDGKVLGPVLVRRNAVLLGKVDAGIDMTFDFPDLIVHAARTRSLGAGTIVGSGTVSNRGLDGGPGRPIDDGGVGYGCLAEVRVVETLLHGAPRTAFLRRGESVGVEMLDRAGRSLFGAIEQWVGQEPPPTA